MITIIAAGAPCTCKPGRVVRFVVPPVPGVPTGEVSCRPADSARHAEVRYHAPAAGALIALHVAGVP